MKKTSRIFMGVAVAALLLLSCNDTGLNASGGDDGSNIYVAKEGDSEKPPYKEPYNDPYDTTVVIIDGDVQQWMAEQIESKSNERKLIVISDMHLWPDPKLEAGLSTSATIDSNGKVKVKYFLKGKEISAEEYNRIAESVERDTNRGKRNLSIPGKMIQEDSLSWTVMITAEELAGLSEKYYEIAISFYRAPQNSLPMND